MSPNRPTFESALDSACEAFPDDPRLRPALAACRQLESGIKNLVRAVCKGEHTHLGMAWQLVHDGEERARATEGLLAEGELEREAAEILASASAGLQAHAESAAIVFRVLLGAEPFAQEVAGG